MPPTNKRKKHTAKASNESTADRKKVERCKTMWKDSFDAVDELAEGLKNPKGKTQTFEENKMMLLGLKAALKQRLQSADEKEADPRDINWTAIELEVAGNFGCSERNLCQLRKAFFVDGDVVVFDAAEDSKRGAANSDHSNNKQNVPSEHLVSIAKFTDEFT